MDEEAVFLSLMCWMGTKRRWSVVDRRWFRSLIVLDGPLSIITIEAGWWMAVVGRQPWVFLKTSDTATSSGQVDLMLMLFSGLYVIPGIRTIVVLS
ncbi:MAG TPA: cytochrome ubiquinol oxidase subunit I [Bacillota bacterium]